jgi:hypothetical protein
VVSWRGRWPSSGLVVAAGGEKATGVVGLDGEGAEGWVRREQKLTGVTPDNICARIKSRIYTTDYQDITTHVMNKSV